MKKRREKNCEKVSRFCEDEDTETFSLAIFYICCVLLFFDSHNFRFLLFQLYKIVKKPRVELSCVFAIFPFNKFCCWILILILFILSFFLLFFYLKILPIYSRKQRWLSFLLSSLSLLVALISLHFPFNLSSSLFFVCSIHFWMATKKFSLKHFFLFLFTTINENKLHRRVSPWSFFEVKFEISF